MEPRPCEQFDAADAGRKAELVTAGCALAGLIQRMDDTPIYRGGYSMISCSQCQATVTSRPDRIEVSGADYVVQTYPMSELFPE